MAPLWLSQLTSQALVLAWGYPILVLNLVSSIKYGFMFHKGLSSMFGPSTKLLFLFHVPLPS